MAKTGLQLPAYHGLRLGKPASEFLIYDFRFRIDDLAVTMSIPLLLFGPSLLGLLLIIVCCFIFRRWFVLVGMFALGLLLHLLSASILNGGGIGYSEPSASDMANTHEMAVLYFFVGLPFLVAPMLLKFLYVYFLAHRKQPPSNALEPK